MLKFVTFVVTAENHPDVLAPAVLLLHRLAIPIHALTMIRPERSSGRIHMTIHLADSCKNMPPKRVIESVGMGA
jgi:aconitase B